MKAVVCHAWGPISSLTVEDLPLPEPGDNQVRLATRAIGLNFLDTLIVQGRYQLKPPFPFSPCAEASGVITALGAGVRDWQVGDRAIFRGSYGALTEEMLVDPASLTRMPADVSWEDAAALSMTYTTALHALRDRGGVVAGETVLILGAGGGVGSAAVQLAKALSLRTIAVVGDAQKGDICKTAGADAVLNHREGDLREQIKAATRDDHIDVVLDTVGGEQALVALRSLSKNGRFLIVGFASGDIPQLPANLLLVKNAVAIGVTANFSREDAAHYQAMMAELLAWVQTGKIAPAIGATFSFSEAIPALQALADRKYGGKIIIKP